MSDYVPINGWFDLSKLNLPKTKFKQYAELQRLGDEYQKKRDYYKKHNNAQWEQLKELCAKMNIDLILNYGALEKEDTAK